MSDEIVPGEFKASGQPIELRPKDDLPFRLIVNRDDRNRCAHLEPVVDDNKRTVSCRDCGTVLDTFAVLSRVAHDHERYTRTLANLQTEVRAAAERLSTLKRLEDNARNRLKQYGHHGTRSHFDALCKYVSKQVARPVTDKDVRLMYDSRRPDQQIEAGLHALKAGSIEAAIEIIRTALYELEAALPPSRSEQ